MEQWIAKSINYLYGEKLVPMTAASVATYKDGRHYEATAKRLNFLPAYRTLLSA